VNDLGKVYQELEIKVKDNIIDGKQEVKMFKGFMVELNRVMYYAYLFLSDFSKAYKFSKQGIEWAETLEDQIDEIYEWYNYKSQIYAIHGQLLTQLSQFNQAEKALTKSMNIRKDRFGHMHILTSHS